MAYKLDFGKVAEAKAAADAKTSSFGSSTSVKWLKFDGRKMKLRFMPPWTGEGPFGGKPWRVVEQHWGVTEDSKAPILCPKLTPHMAGGQKECPICDFVDQLRASTDDVEAKALANKLKAKQAFLYSVVDLADPEYSAKDVSDWKKDRPDKDCPFSAGDPKIQVYAANFTVHNSILSVCEQGVDIFDLEKGMNVQIEKTSAGGGNKYAKYVVTVIPKQVSSGIANDFEFTDLTTVTYNHTTEKLKELLSNGIGGDFLALSAPVVEHKALPKKAAAKPSKVVHEDDVEDEELALGEDEDDDISELERRMTEED